MSIAGWAHDLESFLYWHRTIGEKSGSGEKMVPRNTLSFRAGDVGQTVTVGLIDGSMLAAPIVLSLASSGSVTIIVSARQTFCQKCCLLSHAVLSPVVPLIPSYRYKVPIAEDLQGG